MAKTIKKTSDLIVFEDDTYKVIYKNVPEGKESIAEALAPYGLAERAMDGIYQGRIHMVGHERKGLMEPLIDRWDKLRKALKV